jgi:hypothetical protein
MTTVFNVDDALIPFLLFLARIHKEHFLYSKMSS